MLLETGGGDIAEIRGGTTQQRVPLLLFPFYKSKLDTEASSIPTFQPM